jgi:hypothetical protein
MAWKLGSERQQHLRLRPVYNRNEHRGWTRRGDAGATPEVGIEIHVTALCRRRRIMQRRGNVEA